jgi:chromosome segregation ATPase
MSDHSVPTSGEMIEAWHQYPLLKEQVATLEAELARRDERIAELWKRAQEAETQADEQGELAERAEVELARLREWGKQVHDALNGRPLPELPDEAPARIARLREALQGIDRALEERPTPFLAQKIRGLARAALNPLVALEPK